MKWTDRLSRIKPKLTAKQKRMFKNFAAGLTRYNRFLLACHVSPEGDAIGSLLAMESLLKRLGKKTAVVSEDPFPKRLQSCLPDKTWRPLREFEKHAFDFQALVLTDCPSLERIGKVTRLIRPETAIFNIDHHISNDFFGDYNFVRGNAAATAEVVYELFKYFRLPLTRQESSMLYVGLATDTGSFKYGNTTAFSHRMAADLIAHGIPVEKINDAIHGTSSLNRIKLYSRLFARVKTAAHGSIAWVGMTLEDLKHSGATHEDAEGFIDFLRYLREVKIAFFMSELHSPGHEIRVSLRSKGTYDVNKIATVFKGGGHKKAAGCIITGPLAEVETKIVATIKKELEIR